MCVLAALAVSAVLDVAVAEAAAVVRVAAVVEAAVAVRDVDAVQAAVAADVKHFTLYIVFPYPCRNWLQGYFL
ncbi:hypothetical protein [Halobacillus halophilus]|uniref:hypothetical protein n=1 Tax=Halobacillus halophilus TaxID=1570 RepID=UPI0005A20632|nr:hypothetical protein [Halobacillus halophilus]